MRRAVGLAILVWCALGGVQDGWAQTEKRVALVIGNSAYQHTRPLPNPKNDAEALAKLLQEKGFAVTLKSDLDYRAMREAVRAFGESAREADVALVYYGGHGLEVGGQNYLMPTDAKLVRESDLEYEVVALASVMNAAANARRLRVVILDACRNNPLGEQMQPGGGATRAVTRGLARIEPRRDVLVAYAAKEGTVALDGSGRHSPYAEALLKHLRTPGLDVRLMFGKVRDQVLDATRHQQEPYTYGSLSGDAVPLVPGASLTKDQDVELTFWASVKDSKTPAVLRTYLERYPDGEFATIARALIEHYERQLKAEVAEREEARRRQDEERIVAAVKRIEEERRAREAVLGEERMRAEEGKNSTEAKAVEEKQRDEWLAQTEELKKLTEQMRQTSAALAAAEQERLKAVKEAEDARKAAEGAIAMKREVEKAGNPTKLAALPKLDAGAGSRPFDGTWTVTWRSSECGRQLGSYSMTIAGGVIDRREASLAPSGAARWMGGNTGVYYKGVLRGAQGSGTFTNTVAGCNGTWTATRQGP